MKKPLYSKIVAQPTLQIDMEGNLEKEQVNRETLQPIDKVQVKNTRRILPSRQNLSDSTHQEASENLKQHNTETLQKLNEEKIKMKKQQNISKKERETKIVEMFARASCKMGLAPLSKKYTQTVCKQMTNKGIIKRSENLETRNQ